MFNKQEFNPFKTLYIWDNLEKKGFPMSPDILCCDMEAPGARDVVVRGNPEEIETFLHESGMPLTELLADMTMSFMALLIKLFEDEGPERKQQVLDTMRAMWTDGGDA